jgi:hypothetical protein
MNARLGVLSRPERKVRVVPEPDLMPVHGLYDLAVVRGPLKCPLSLCRYGLTTKIT